MRQCRFSRADPETDNFSETRLERRPRICGMRNGLEPAVYDSTTYDFEYPPSLACIMDTSICISGEKKNSVDQMKQGTACLKEREGGGWSDGPSDGIAGMGIYDNA